MKYGKTVAGFAISTAFVVGACGGNLGNTHTCRHLKRSAGHFLPRRAALRRLARA